MDKLLKLEKTAVQSKGEKRAETNNSEFNWPGKQGGSQHQPLKKPIQDIRIRS